MKAGVTKIAKVEENTGDLNTPRTATDMGSYSSSLEIVSERATPVAVLATTPIDFVNLMWQAWVTCEKHRRLDIITTYVCNLRNHPKDVFEVAKDLKYIAHLKNDISFMFVPIRY